MNLSKTHIVQKWLTKQAWKVELESLNHGIKRQNSK